MRRILHKTTSRERSLWYLTVWYESDKRTYREWADIELAGSLFISEGATRLVTAWYDTELSTQFSNEVERRVLSDADYRARLALDTESSTAALRPFMNGERTLASLDDLSIFRTLLVDWWVPFSVLLEVPDMRNPPAHLLEIALTTRNETETWADEADKMFFECVERIFPQAKEISSVLLPGEIGANLNAADADAISKRVRGYGLIDGEVFLATELPAELIRKGYEFFIEATPVILGISFTREYSLLFAQMRSEAGSVLRMQLAGFDPHRCIVAEGATGKMVFWYSKEEFWDLLSKIAHKFTSEPILFDLVLEQYFDLYEELLPYFEKKLMIADLTQFKKVYDFAYRWRGLADLVNDIGRSKFLSDEIKEKAIQAREKTQHYYDESDNLYKQFFADQKLKAAFRDIITYQEFLALCETRTLADKVLKRTQGYLLCDGKLFLTTERAQALASIGCIIAESDSAVALGTKEIRGVVASKGKTRGVVRILKYRSQIGDLLEGEVLVTEMTTPDYLPAMQKAAAIITNEGGITSHAAIISRELGKPCVVGTKNATTVLKNGDSVEVDADNGVITILQ